MAQSKPLKIFARPRARNKETFKNNFCLTMECIMLLSALNHFPHFIFLGLPIISFLFLLHIQLMMGETDPKDNLWPSVVVTMHRMDKFRHILDRWLFLEKWVVNQLIDLSWWCETKIQCQKRPSLVPTSNCWGPGDLGWFSFLSCLPSIPPTLPPPLPAGRESASRVILMGMLLPLPSAHIP